MPARGQERHRQKPPLVTNVTKALGRRGGFSEVVTRGQDGPIEFEVKFRESGGRLATYSLKIGAEGPRGIVLSEVLKFRRGNRGQPWAFLNFARGKGTAIVNEDNHGDEHTKAEREEQSLDSADIRVASDFRKLIESWHITQFGRTGGLLHTAYCILQSVYATCIQQKKRFGRFVVETLAALAPRTTAATWTAPWRPAGAPRGSSSTSSCSNPNTPDRPDANCARPEPYARCGRSCASSLTAAEFGISLGGGSTPSMPAPCGAACGVPSAAPGSYLRLPALAKRDLEPLTQLVNKDQTPVVLWWRPPG